jgi:hypothetical protein
VVTAVVAGIGQAEVTLIDGAVNARLQESPMRGC